MCFQDYDYAVWKGANKVYQVLLSWPTSKIDFKNGLKQQEAKRDYSIQTQVDCSNEKR